MDIQSSSQLSILSKKQSSSGKPSGNDKEVQFNDGGSFGGDSDFTYDKTSNFLNLNGSMTIEGNLKVNGSTTTVHTDNLVIKDKLIAINASSVDPNGEISASSSGIVIYDNVSASNVFIGLNHERVFSVATAANLSASDTNPNLSDSNLNYNIDLRGNNASFTNISASGTLDVTGATGIDGDFDISTNKFTVDSSSGNTSIAGTLNVTGNASFTNISASGTLDVTGNASFTNASFTNISATNASFSNYNGPLTNGVGSVFIGKTTTSVDGTITPGNTTVIKTAFFSDTNPGHNGHERQIILISVNLNFSNTFPRASVHLMQNATQIFAAGSIDANGNTHNTHGGLTGGSGGGAFNSFWCFSTFVIAKCGDGDKFDLKLGTADITTIKHNNAIIKFLGAAEH
jgi:hypothetical protein